MGGQRTTLGNGTTTANLIADSFSVAIDPQVTSLQLWNIALANLRGLDVVGNLKHDTYPHGFSGVILLLDGHIALQYGILSAPMGFDHVGELNVLICSNAGPATHEEIRARLNNAYTDLQP